MYKNPNPNPNSTLKPAYNSMQFMRNVFIGTVFSHPIPSPEINKRIESCDETHKAFVELNEETQKEIERARNLIRTGFGI